MSSRTVEVGAIVAAWPLVALVLALTMLTGYFLGASDERVVTVNRTLPACEFEDGPAPCYWDAETMGNGYGHDVVITEED